MKGCGCSFRIKEPTGDSKICVGEYVHTCPKTNEENEAKVKYLGIKDYNTFEVEYETLVKKIEEGKIQVDVIETIKEIDKNDN